MDEISTLSQAVAGDEEALVQLLKQHGASLAAFVRDAFPRRLASQVAVEDVLQSIYADAFLAIRQARFSDPRDFPAWLRTIGRNNIRDLVRFLEADKRGGGHLPVPVAADTASQSLLLDLLPGDSATPSRAMRCDEAAELLQ